MFSSAYFKLGSHVLLCLATTVALLACGGEDKSQKSAVPSLTVSTVTVTTKPLPLVIETVGRAEGSKAVEVRARVSGILEKQVYNEGERIDAGRLLFRIEAAPFEIALAHARATLAEQQAQNLQAKRNSERLSNLAKANAVSQRTADDALSAVEASDAALLAAQADVREAELNLSYTKVVAPIAGITGRALHSEGSLVTAGTDSSLLTTVTQTNPMWVRFALSETEFAALRTAESKRDALSVALLDKDGTARSGQGSVNFSASTIDETLGTVQLRAEFANDRLAVLPGEYVRVRLSGGERETVTVPQIAVLQNAKGPFVWLMTSDGHAEQRPVKTGAWSGTEWLVNEGLQQGDIVIVDNLLKLKPGQAVQAKADSADGNTSSASAPAADARGGG